MLFTGLGRAVLGKTVLEVSSTALGLRPRAALETSGTVFPNTARPRPVNNIYIFRVTGANQNARQLLSTDLVNTNKRYSESQL